LFSPCDDPAWFNGTLWPVPQSMSVSWMGFTFGNEWPTARVGTGAVGLCVARIGEGLRNWGGSELLGRKLVYSILTPGDLGRPIGWARSIRPALRRRLRLSQQNGWRDPP